MKVRHMIAGMALALSFVGGVQAAVLDLGEMELVAQEIGPFKVRILCASGSGVTPPSACRELQSVAPMMTFRLMNKMTGVDAGDREALRSSPTPMTTVIGQPISQQAMGTITGGDVCTRRVIQSDAVDQYGGAWKLTPYMYLVGDVWTHRWTVTPQFAGYQASVVQGQARVTVLRDRAELERRLGVRWDFLRRYLNLDPFGDARGK